MWRRCSSREEILLEIPHRCTEAIELKMLSYGYGTLMGWKYEAFFSLVWTKGLMMRTFEANKYLLPGWICMFWWWVRGAAWPWWNPFSAAIGQSLIGFSPKCHVGCLMFNCTFKLWAFTCLLWVICFDRLGCVSGFDCTQCICRAASA